MNSIQALRKINDSCVLNAISIPKFGPDWTSCPCNLFQDLKFRVKPSFSDLKYYVNLWRTHKQKKNKETCSSLLGLRAILHDSRLVALRALTHSLHAAFDSPPEFEPGMKALLNQSNMLVERHAT